MLKKLLCVLMLVPLLNACSSSSADLIGKKRAPINFTTVKVYYEPPETYEAIANISGESRLAVTPELKGALKKLKREAGKVGANAVLVTAINEEEVEVWLGPSLGKEYADRRKKVVNGVAIYIPEVKQGE